MPETLTGALRRIAAIHKACAAKLDRSCVDAERTIGGLVTVHRDCIPSAAASRVERLWRRGAAGDDPVLVTRKLVAAQGVGGQRRPSGLGGISVRRVAIVYAIGVVVVTGWAAYLGVSLPHVAVARNWDVAWVGLDGLIVMALAWTAWGAAHRDRRVVIPAVATATLLVVDAWMDVSTASRSELWQSILLAAAFELPIALMSLSIARRAMRAIPQPRDESSDAGADTRQDMDKAESAA